MYPILGSFWFSILFSTKVTLSRIPKKYKTSPTCTSMPLLFSHVARLLICPCHSSWQHPGEDEIFVATAWPVVKMSCFCGLDENRTPSWDSVWESSSSILEGPVLGRSVSLGLHGWGGRREWDRCYRDFNVSPKWYQWYGQPGQRVIFLEKLAIM